jgi:hypothetical protein
MKSSSNNSYSKYIQKFQQAKTEAEEFLAPMDDRMFRRQPSGKSWCIGECFSHLVEAGSMYYLKVEKGVEKAKKKESGNKHPMHLRLHMKWFVNYLEPPISVKAKAPGSFQPVEYAKLDKEEVLNDFLDLQNEYISQLKFAENNNLDLSSVKVPNPIISLIKMTPAECIAVTESHQRRHMEQARKVKELLEGKS